MDLLLTCSCEQDQPKKKAKKQKKTKQKTKGEDEKRINGTEDDVTYIEPLKQDVSYINNVTLVSYPYLLTASSKKMQQLIMQVDVNI